MIEQNQHVLEYVDDYFHDVLSSRDAEMVRTHCADCRICQVALEEAEHRRDALAAVPRVEASEQLIQQTVDRFSKHKELPIKRWTHVFWAAAVAAGLIIATCHIYYANLQPSPYDLTVLGQTELMAGTDASLRVRLVNRETGKPIQDVPVEIALVDKERRETYQLTSFVTGDDGSASPRFQLPDWKDGDYTLYVRATPDGDEELLRRTVKLRRSWQLMLSTDKPVYQPGQVIRVRSLALRRPDLKPVAGEDVEYSITDPKGNVIFRRKDVSSNYGIVSTDCPLATEIIEGLYQIQCQVGDTTSKATVEVKKYVLPKFKVDVALDKPYYEPGTLLRGTVEAKYFFGKSVAGGTVNVVSPDVPQLDAIKVTTDDDGKAEFELRLPDYTIGHNRITGDTNVSLVVTVRDTAGQKHEKRISRVITTNPIRIEVIPEAGTLVPRIENRVYILTSYADGRPAKTRIAVSGRGRELETNKLGVATLSVVPKPNSLDLTLRATDADGVIGRRNTKLLVGRPAEDFLVRTDKAVYDGGDTIRLVMLGGGREPVFVDFIKDGQTLLTDTIEVEGGRGEKAFDLPPELFGTIKLCAYRFDAAGLPIRKSRVLYVRQARSLNIKTKLDRTQYRPGEQAKLRISLTDDQGNPTPGAISLAAVDEAVFSVSSGMPGMEQVFFTLEQELLEPVYAIYPWSPHNLDSVSDARDEFEQALFARTTAERTDRGSTGQQDNGSPHTLAEDSYSKKSQKILVRKYYALPRITMAWVNLGIVCSLGAMISLLGVRATFTIIGSFFGVCVLILLLILLSIMVGCGSTEALAPKSDSAAKEANPNPLAANAPSTLLNPNDTSPVRVRQWFPETLLWRPELITDDKGVATIDVDLADSITSWRLSTSAVSAAGQLGASQRDIRVFQPFFVDLNLPVALTRGDEVSVPVVIYNYLDKPQTIKLTLNDAEWFELLDKAEATVELKPGAVESLYFRLRAKNVGQHELQVTARGGEVADAIKRSIAVEPDGRRVEQVANGNLQQPATVDVSVPERAILGSAKTIVKLYPSSFSQLVEGLNGIFQRPYGCFEQTSSTTYPNVLALDYLRRTNKSVPQVEAKARQFIHLGYQRLLTFEVPGGGFDWFGRAPANRTLTAYGLMEFEDMAKVYDVDPQLLKRTRNWLMKQRKQDGSWDAEMRSLHNDPTRGRGTKLARLSTTAYIAWSVFRNQQSAADAKPTLEYLRSHRPADIASPYALAVLSNALLSIDPSGDAAAEYLARLDAMKRTSADGKLVWWEQVPGGRTTFYGAGRSGNVETTATAALAMIRGERHPATVRGALAWLTTQRDARGTWHSTQGTVLALKALIAGTAQSLGGDAKRRVEIALDGKKLRDMVISADEHDVVRQIDLSDEIGSGDHRITLTDRAGDTPGYQVAFRYYVPDEKRSEDDSPLSITIDYSDESLRVDDLLTVNTTVTNNTESTAPMVIADLPIPAGFRLEGDDFDQLVQAGTIAKYQVTARSVIVYLRGLAPHKSLKLQYRLRATTPVKVTTPAAWVYEYYDPDVKASSPSTKINVVAKG